SVEGNQFVEVFMADKDPSLSESQKLLSELPRKDWQEGLFRVFLFAIVYSLKADPEDLAGTNLDPALSISIIRKATKAKSYSDELEFVKNSQPVDSQKF